MHDADRFQFVDIGSRECYVGMLYACYDLLRLDFVMEISWRHGLNDFTMVGLPCALRHGEESSRYADNSI